MEISDEELCCEENSQLHHQVQESVEQGNIIEIYDGNKFQIFCF